MTAPKQTLPTTDALQAALEALEAARDAFAVACSTVRDRLDLTPLTTALAAWRTATDAATDIDAYVSERSERWLASARGQAVERWQQDLQDLQLRLDPEDSLHLDIDLTGDAPDVEIINDPDDILPSTPELPALEDFA